jgi:deoxycytidine triphosphate deaminase
MAERAQDHCGKCGAEIDESRRIDYTLKDGTRVCDSCFVRGTARQAQSYQSTEEGKIRGWDL